MHSRAARRRRSLRSTTAWTPRPRAVMVMQNMLAARPRRPAATARCPIFPDPDLPRQGRRQLQPRRARTTICSSLAVVLPRQAPVPQLLASVDAPFNLQYYKPGHPETEIAYMGCRTRVYGQRRTTPTREITPAAATCRSPSINLPRIAIRSQGRYASLVLRGARPQAATWCIDQLLSGFEIQCAKQACTTTRSSWAQGVWMDREKLGPDRRGSARCCSTAR
ncbi:MAG: hypothetical protein ACLR4Z_09355 [Butyricicoccaceae bacterium]